MKTKIVHLYNYDNAETDWHQKAIDAAVKKAIVEEFRDLISVHHSCSYRDPEEQLVDEDAYSGLFSTVLVFGPTLNERMEE